jgi:hypothetical protein
MLVMTATLIGAFRAERLTTSVSNRRAAVEELADQFRLDVATASAAPEKWKDDMAGPSCLLLRRPDGQHLMYRWEADRLERRELGEPDPVVRPMALGGDTFKVEFVRSSEDHPLIVLKISEVRNGITMPRLEVRAALGGDLR